MSVYLNLTDKPGANTVADVLHKFGTNLFFRIPKTFCDPFSTLDEHYDYLMEMKDRAPGVFEFVDNSAKEFMNRGPDFVERYIHIDAKYYENIGALKEYFNGLDGYDVVMTLFGKTLFDPKEKFYGDMIGLGICDIRDRTGAFFRVVDRTMHYFEHKYNLYPYPKVAGT